MKKHARIAPKIAAHVAELWQRGLRRASRLDERTHGWLGVLVDASQAILNPNSGITAAAMAYYALFSLFPLTLLSLAIASFSFGPATPWWVCYGLPPPFSTRCPSP